jgi:NAD(P)-dependent dehydrogenase (short-subunit alcohol dehydrogenase family)
MRLKDKVSIVTGASSGIGRAIAQAFAGEGAKIVVADVKKEPNEGGPDTASLINQNGGDAVFFQTDVVRTDSVEALIKATVSTYGRLDVMVNNAGINIIKRAIDMTEEEFDRIMAVNVKGVFLGATHAIRQMIKQGEGGSVVNTASNFGLVGCPQMSTYCATKGAVIQLTKVMAIEYGTYGIRVNALCPGATKTTINEEIRKDKGIMDEWRRMTPLVRPDGEFLGEPQDQANGAIFLASDESRYMTGACLIIDGGWNAG